MIRGGRPSVLQDNDRLLPLLSLLDAMTDVEAKTRFETRPTFDPFPHSVDVNKIWMPRGDAFRVGIVTLSFNDPNDLAIRLTVARPSRQTGAFTCKCRRKVNDDTASRVVLE